jgi:hypothetical protein
MILDIKEHVNLKMYNYRIFAINSGQKINIS